MQTDGDMESHTGHEGGAEVDPARKKHRDACKKYYESKKRKRDHEPTPAPEQDDSQGQYISETPMATGYPQQSYFNPYAVFSHEEALAIKILAKEANGEKSRGPMDYALPIVASLGLGRKLLDHKDQIFDFLKNIALSKGQSEQSNQSLPVHDAGTQSAPQLGSYVTSVSQLSSETVIE